MGAEQEVRPDNRMGRWGATSYIVGNIVGAGIFVAPTSIAKQVNSVGMSLAIWVLSAAICTMGGYCYLELGTSINRSGGDFAYLCFAKWRAVAFAFMAVGCMLVYPMQLAIAAGAAGEYIVQGLGLDSSQQLSGADGFWVRKLFGFSIVCVCILAFWLILFLNFFSVRRFVAPFQIASSFTKLCACTVIVGVGFFQILIKGETEHFRSPFANTTYQPGHIANALFAGFYSYDGWDILNWGAEEVQDPQSSMSFAMVTGMACVTTIYTAMNVAYYTLLGPAQMQMSDAVAMTFAEQIIGRQAAQWTIPLVINLVLLGSINGTMFIASRYLFAAARERQLPAFIACVNQQHDSPRVALLVHVLLAFALSFLGSTDQLIVAMGFAQWFQRCFTMCALLYIRLSSIPVQPGAMRTPLLLPLLFLAICSGLSLVTLVQEFASACICLVVLGLASLVYSLFLWEQTLQRWSPYRQAAQTANEGLSIIAQLLFGGRIELMEEEEENGAKQICKSD